MQKEIITKSAAETQKLGKGLAQEILTKFVKNKSDQAVVVCLSGDLGSGKTTFTQGLLEGLGAEGPYTSPTFTIMKQYNLDSQKEKLLRATCLPDKQASCELRDIYHIDAYRVEVYDILNLGWEEIIADSKNIVIVEWAEKIEKIIPASAVWVEFEHSEKNKRKVFL